MNLRLAIGSTSGKKQLLIRVKRIMEINSNTNFNYGQKLAALFLITGIICSVAWLSPQRNENKTLQVTKKQDITYNKKIGTNPKFETIFLRQPDIKTVTTAAVKLQVKKQLTKAELQLKELKYLNLKQIAERESNRWNLLLQQSRKAVSGAWEKLNRNKFFIVRDGVGGTVFTTNGALLPYRELAAQQVYAADLEKFQGQMNNVQFNFSVQFDKMQNAVKDYYNPDLFDQKEMMLIQKKLKDGIIEKQVKVETTRGSARAVTFVHGNGTAVTTSGRESNRTFFAADSLAGEELKLVYRSRAAQPKEQGPKALTSTENKNAPEPKPSANWYAYGYSTDEARNKNTNVVKVSPGATVVYEAQVPVTPEVTESRYRSTAPVRENNAPKIYLQRSTAPSKNIHVECKNGVVYLNGKLLDLPETNEVVAQVILKGKKLTSKIKNINIDVND
jgi:hypothetical protein